MLAQVFKNTREEENLVEVSQPIVSAYQQSNSFLSPTRLSRFQFQDSEEEETGHEGHVHEYEPKDRVTERTHEQESRAITLKPLDQATSQNGADLGEERKSKSSESNQGLAGVDVFFAKQLLRRRGPPSPPQTDKV